MTSKEVPRAGLVKAALAGRITTPQGATALHLSVRQFQRLKQRFRAGGMAPGLRVSYTSLQPDGALGTTSSLTRPSRFSFTRWELTDRPAAWCNAGDTSA